MFTFFFQNSINPSNFGFTKDLKLKIVDFQISEYYLEVKYMLSRYLTDDFSLINKFELKQYFYMKIDKKKELTKIFFENLDINEMLETLNLLYKNFSQNFKKLEKYKIISSKLDTYVNTVKENYEKFSITFKC